MNSRFLLFLFLFWCFAQPLAGEDRVGVRFLREFSGQFELYCADFTYFVEQVEGATRYADAMREYKQATGQMASPEGEVNPGVVVDFSGTIKRIGKRFRRTDTIDKGERTVQHMVGSDGECFYSNNYGSDYLMLDSKVLQKNWYSPDIHSIFQKSFMELPGVNEESLDLTEVLSSGSLNVTDGEDGLKVLSAQIGSKRYAYSVDLSKARVEGVTVFRRFSDGVEVVVFAMQFKDHMRCPGSEVEIPHTILAKCFGSVPNAATGKWDHFLMRNTRIQLSNLRFGNEVDDTGLDIPFSEGLLVIDRIRGGEYTIRDAPQR